MKRDAATEAQVMAARPDSSVWLSANAGSGKTRVLTDRVARLLFDGVSPAHVLCLTYTKAAASEMQNRLFDRLGAWAMLSNDRLRVELRRLGIDDDLPESKLAHARRLFALAIETPGGLRIQTIHSFCASLLRRFPLEAGVSPQFKEIEDRAADILRAEVLENLSSGPDAQVVAGVAKFYSDTDLVTLCKAISTNRDAFDPPRTRAQICAAYGVSEDLTLDDVIAEAFSGDLPFIAEIEPMIAAGSSNDQKLAAALRDIKSASLDGLLRLEKWFLTGAKAAAPFSAKTGSVPTKGTQKGPIAPLLPRLDALMRRVETARAGRVSVMAVERDLALHAFAERYLRLYEGEKQRRGWLDFDDLIDRTRALLTNDDVAAWILYRLDGNMDHILVDEAQDTSPRQWQVIERLAHELKSGAGSRDDVLRTIFVVGDKKQSIYSFQGADPGEFDRMCDEFDAGLRESRTPLLRQSLAFSFRSAEPVLRVVDNTFTGREAAGFSHDQLHRAFKDRMPGRVDLWPLVEKSDDDQSPEDDWFRPVDRVSSRHHHVILAQRIARFMKETIEAGTTLPDEIEHSGQYRGRRVRAGDFLILVRRRNRLFAEIIRACKQIGLPIAGSDRLKVTAELAVRDLGALLAFLATPEDDHSLAVALRSPLFGVDEQVLFDLAHRRGDAFLWRYLQSRKGDFGSIVTVLEDLQAQTDFLRPYDLIERILIRHDGRKRLLGRLGDEAEDGIDALLSQALAYERTEVPSLTGFLQWMTTDDLEIKRQMDAEGDRIRVMTVHGAKGLEAPIVILPDCEKRRDNDRETILSDDMGAFWKMPEEDRPPRQTATIAARAETRAREDDRLLYVAMTRAEKWLIVAASGDLGKGGDTWYDRVGDALVASGAESTTFNFGPTGIGQGLRLQAGDWALPEHEQPAAAAVPIPEVPEHFLQPAPPAPGRPETLTPSDLGGAKALPGPDNADEDAAQRRGALIHMLLEKLPDTSPEDRESVAHDLLRLSGETLSTTESANMIAEVLRVLDDPSLAWIFADETLAEVPVTAPLVELNGGRMFGVIDRLLIADDRVLAVDFKSNQTVPATATECPEGILRQMGAYAAILQAIYPDRQIQTAILWTATATCMPLDHGLIRDALGRVSVP